MKGLQIIGFVSVILLILWLIIVLITLNSMKSPKYTPASVIEDFSLQVNGSIAGDINVYNSHSIYSSLNVAVGAHKLPTLSCVLR